ncbi:hypothetical protein IE53DRAFT_388328 [Violaceomyces palustris]|uniref:Uncharacterized protein n=1 Tax=Violaceomyces palustris TaxID=1673888 RepID=A0ACD0NUD9_9BASI|nr:hypothetical protein IE53DRAFT_388328 [Violaceomyces palustris]
MKKVQIKNPTLDSLVYEEKYEAIRRKGRSVQRRQGDGKAPRPPVDHVIFLSFPLFLLTTFLLKVGSSHASSGSAGGRKGGGHACHIQLPSKPGLLWSGIFHLRPFFAFLRV